jgi:glycolate oxidase iron-sulfur subunit
MRAAADRRITLDGAFQEHINLCLGCRACETACPSGVQYGLLLETAKAALAKSATLRRSETEGQGFAEVNGEKSPSSSALSLSPRTSVSKRNSVVETIQHFGLHELMPHRARLRLLACGRVALSAVGVSQSSHVTCCPSLPPALTTMEGMAPPIDLGFLDLARPAPALGPQRGKVAFFTGCVQDAFLAGVNRATVRVLQRNGYEVHFPAGADVLQRGRAPQR